jgi:hypothetical protein
VLGPIPLSAISLGSSHPFKTFPPIPVSYPAVGRVFPIYRRIFPPTFLSLTRVRLRFSRRSLIVDGPFPSPPWSRDDINSSYGPGLSHENYYTIPISLPSFTNLRSPWILLSRRYSGQLSARAARLKCRRLLRSATASPAPVAPLSLYLDLLSAFTPIQNNLCQRQSTQVICNWSMIHRRRK